LDYYILDFFDGIKYYQKINLNTINFAESTLYILKEKNRKELVSTENILKYYEAENGDYFIKYIKELDRTSFTLKSAIDFTTSGLLTSRKAVVDMFLLEEKQNYLLRNQLDDILLKLIKVSNKIKLLLVKLHFLTTSKDVDKLKKYIYQFKEYEALLIKKMMRG